MRTRSSAVIGLVLLLVVTSGCASGTSADGCPKWAPDDLTKIVPPLTNMSLEHAARELGGDWPYDWQGGHILWVRYQYPPAYCRHRIGVGDVVILSSDPIKLPE